MSNKTFHSPIEDFLDIERGTTELPSVRKEEKERSLTQAPEVTLEVTSGADSKLSPEYEDEDKQVKEQLSTVYDYAIDAFENQNILINQIDPKFAARNAEVAAQYLKIALDAAAERAKNRDNKEKLKLEKVSPGNIKNITNNNLVVGDRNDILELLKKSRPLDE